MVIFADCKKDSSSSSNIFEGVLLEKGNTACPNLVKITKSVDGSLPVNTILTVYDDLDGVDGDVVKFRVIRYALDTSNHLALCVYGKYTAEVELVQ